MRLLISLLTIFLLFSCNPVEQSSSSDRLDFVPEPDKEQREAYEQAQKIKASLKCSAADFLLLSQNELQTEFFSKLDSIRKVQYPDLDQEVNIMVDISPDYLDQFMEDIQIDSLSQNLEFSQDYHFNIAPSEYTDPEKCADNISVAFDPTDCFFRLAVFNTFLVDEDWCVESAVIYAFQIGEGKILNLERNEAG